MDDKLKIAAGIGGAVGVILTFILGLLNLFPTRTSARVVEDRLKFDKEVARDKQTSEEYERMRVDRSYWEKRAHDAEAEIDRLKSLLHACEEETRALKQPQPWNGIERRKAVPRFREDEP